MVLLGRPRQKGQVSVARAKWLLAKWPPVGEFPAVGQVSEERGGSGPWERYDGGLVGETTTFLHTDLT